MSKQRLTSNAWLEHTAAHIHVWFDAPQKIISSAVLNGGRVEASHVLNLRVKDAPSEVDVLGTPEATLAEYCLKQKWQGKVVGMMTAAPMESLHVSGAIEQGVEIVVLATAGLSNPRRAGDPAEYRKMRTSSTGTGTINTIIATDANLTPAAMVEAIVTATEAKAAALQDLCVRSPVSDCLATGTGTDSIVLASSYEGAEIRYCGKHVLFGEILARLVIEAITSSLASQSRSSRG